MAATLSHSSMSDPEWVSLDELGSIPLPEWNGRPEEEVAVFAGLSHAEVLALEFPQERMLIEDLVPIGAVGTIAGVPETYKSWQAQTIAIAVARGEGGIFRHSVSHAGPVGYFWQDDSTREEAERIKLFDQIRGDGSDVAVRWFLNEGLRLPEHISRLRESIVHYGFVLVVLDSFYNVLFGIDLKDEEAERVVALLKSEVCDVTNCTVLIVDHMPWATDQNRKRLRAYGGVFKGAAVRFGIYLDAVGNKTYVEARGNNISGFKRQLAEWDPDALELKLIDSREAVPGEEYEQRILDYLAENGWTATKQIDSKVMGRGAEIRAARLRLEQSEEPERRLIRAKSRELGLTSKGEVWNLALANDSAPPRLFGTTQEAIIGVPTSPTSPRRGGLSRDVDRDLGQIENDDEEPPF